MEPSFFEDFEKVYHDLTFCSDISAVLIDRKNTFSSLLTLFRRPDAAAATKLQAKQPLLLSHLPQGSKYKGTAGKDGKHAAACLVVSKYLNLHEAQTVLLINRWVRDTGRSMLPGWKPDAQQLQVRCSSEDSEAL
jgi:hypothetical protein